MTHEEYFQQRLKASAVVLAVGLIVLLCTVILAYSAPPDNVEAVPPEIRRWFESVRSPDGVLCCSIADGRVTEYDVKDGHYIVQDHTGEELVVPDEAVVRHSRNPTGRGVVWFGWREGGNRYIRCFVPAAEG